jgi:hypothetical protein
VETSDEHRSDGHRDRPRDADDTDNTDDGAGDDGADVARYEQLRRRALSGDADGWRCGLAVLQTRGVVAWLRAWHGITRPSITLPPRPPAPPRAAPPLQAGERLEAGERLVAALASMALGAVAGA